MKITDIQNMSFAGLPLFTNNDNPFKIRVLNVPVWFIGVACLYFTFFEKGQKND